MSKSDTPLSEIDTHSARKPFRKTKWLEGRSVAAFDTETSDGDVFMLTVSNGDTGQSFAVDNGGETLGSDFLLDWLTRRPFRNTINVWFNLGFDAEVILKGLGRELLEETLAVNEVEYGDYQILYIPNKLLEIRKGRDVYSHYDVAGLFQSNLKTAAEKWGGIEKLDETVDTSRFGDSAYVSKHFSDIRRYAVRDAEATRKAAEALFTKAESLGIPCGRPISTGYLAAEYIREKLSMKPGWSMDFMQTDAWEAFHGGRFEVFERGQVGYVAGPDINSAYPAVMAQLPDPGTLAWEDAYKPSFSDVREASYGYVDVTVTTDPDAKIQPFAHKIDGVVCYPALESVRITVLKDIFEFAVSAGLVQQFEIHRASLGYVTDATQYPFEFFDGLYAERKRLESDGFKKKGKLLKIILNSIYGKTAQTTVRREILTDGSVPETERFGFPLSEKQVGGPLMNPFLASHITGLTRLQLHETVHNLGLVEDTVMFATDCIMLKADAYEQSEFSDLLGNELGQWDFDYFGKAFIIGSGVYEVATTDGLKLGTRGFRDSRFRSLVEAAALAGESPISIEQNRPITLGEAIAFGQEFEIEDIGRFYTDGEKERKLKADFDKKRVWPDADFTTLVSGNQYGRPRVVSD